MRFLGFRLYGPLMSFGDIAVGGQRPSLSAPTKSMLTGILAGSLGIEREDSKPQREFSESIYVATRTDSPGSLLVDFHTAQNPDATRREAFERKFGKVSTRRDELNSIFDNRGLFTPLDTQISWRQYRVDALFAVCVWFKDDNDSQVDRVKEALLKPMFTPFIGRKASVVALPFQPQIVEAENPVLALRGMTFPLDTMIGLITDDIESRTFRWEGDWKDLKASRTETRRDKVYDRDRWQFITRQEHVSLEQNKQETT